MSNLNEIVSTSGDLRRLLAQTMVEIKNGTLPVDRGMAVAALSKEITASLQAEVNVAKVRVAMLQGGNNIGKLTELGRMIVGDDGSMQMISGA